MNNGGLEAMLYDLSNMNISDIDLRKIPVTQALIEHKLHSLESPIKYWSELVENEEETEKKFECPFWGGWIKTTALHNNYMAWCKDHFEKPDDSRLFIKKLKACWPKEVERTQKSRIWGYSIPDNKTCLDSFENFINGSTS